MEIAVENSVAVQVRGDTMPFTGGTLCTKVAKTLDRRYCSIRCGGSARRVSGERVRVFNDHGSHTLKAAVTERARPGAVVAPSVWWRKLSPGGRNANDLTSQALADMGGAAAYYDCLVDVEQA